MKVNSNTIYIPKRIIRAEGRVHIKGRRIPKRILHAQGLGASPHKRKTISPYRMKKKFAFCNELFFIAGLDDQVCQMHQINTFFKSTFE